jgi:formylglycine-generating enzyme required for sulfatase activity
MAGEYRARILPFLLAELEAAATLQELTQLAVKHRKLEAWTDVAEVYRMRSLPLVRAELELAGLKFKDANSMTIQTTHGLDLIGIPPGSFLMGSINSDSNEKPVHTVRLTKAFFLGKTEVTQAQWKAVMGSNPSSHKSDELPVEQVSWEDCIKFCEELTKREHASGALPAGWKYTLPTEAQWEYACRAGTKTKYSFGDDSKSSLGAHAWYEDNSGYETHSVGSKDPNPWGLLDMHGNVWEWCLDWYDSGFYRNGFQEDPVNTSNGRYRVIRGGSYYYGAVYLRSASRNSSTPGYRYDYVGFRLAMIPTK